MPRTLLLSVLCVAVFASGCSAQSPGRPSDGKPGGGEPEKASPASRLLALAAVELKRDAESEDGRFQEMLGLFFSEDFGKAHAAVVKLADDYPSRLIYRHFRIAVSAKYAKSLDSKGKDKDKVKGLIDVSITDAKKLVTDPAHQYFLTVESTVKGDDASDFAALLWLAYWERQAEKPSKELLAAAKKNTDAALLAYCHPFFRGNKRMRGIVESVLGDVSRDIRKTAGRMTDVLEKDVELLAGLAASLDPAEFQRKYGGQLKTLNALIADLTHYGLKAPDDK